METKTIVLAGGCFWCTEAVFRELKGVLSVVSGYTGGDDTHPTYEKVCGGKTGHAECIRVEYDKSSISLHDILTVFLQRMTRLLLIAKGMILAHSIVPRFFVMKKIEKRLMLISRILKR